MTNRQKLLKTSEYDILCRMNRNIKCGAVCVIEAIQGGFADELDMLDISECRSHESCEECIQKWLNEEEKA